MLSRETDPSPPSFVARIEPGALDADFVIVDPGFAAKLTTEHERAFEVEATETPAGPEALTRDIPNVGEDALEPLDDRGVIRVGSPVSPGTLLVGKVAPRGGAGPLSPEDRLLRAIFGEAAGDSIDVSLRAPPGCFGAVREAELDDGRARARVVVSWTRPLDVGDVLEIDGQRAVVAEIRALGADLAWSGGGSTASVRKVAMARDVVHARSIGPYDPATQQPTTGRDRFGAQVLERAQAEVLAAHAPWMLWESLTIRADSVGGRARAYEAIVKGENPALDATPDVTRPAPPAVSSPARSAAPGSAPPAMDVLAFFEKPSRPDTTPEAIRRVAAHLRALGVDVDFDAEEVRATLLSPEAVRAHSHGRVASPSELRSQKVFGPVEDYRCECGKYSRMKHRGVVCETCGVEVVQSRVRRERFGHIEPAHPCVHPYHRDDVATLLEMTREELDRAIASGGGRAAYERLAALDLEAIDAIETGPRAALALRLLSANLPATSLMLEVVAVLPPDLRAAPTPLDASYARVLEARTATEAQRAVDELFASHAAAVDLAWRTQAFTKAVDYSGVAHLTVDPSLAPDACRAPRSMLIELFKPYLFARLEERGLVATIKSARRMVEQGGPEVMQLLEEVIAGHPLLLASGADLIARTATSWDAPAIAVDPGTARRLRARTVVVYLPITHQAALECSTLEDVARGGPRDARGWLSEATTDLDLLGNALRAALTGQRETPDDVLLRCALGRPPPTPDEAELTRWSEQRRARQDAVRNAFVAAAPPEPVTAPNPWLDRAVDELEFSVRTANALQNVGIRTVRELCGMTEADLLRSRNFGRKSLAEVRTILAELGLSLGMRCP